ncbi:MAG TPA: carboxylate transporter, partial [Desulfobacter postgatei]|nr:carboxylate transporter [Desulfobacter postgatei]
MPACLLLVLCVQSIIIFLPTISKHIIHSVLGPLPGNQPLDFTISRLGVNDIQISDIAFGEDLHIDTIGFSYHIDTKNIISVEKIVISGLNVTLHLDEKNRIQVNGFSFPRDKDVDHTDHPVFDISAFESYFSYLPEDIVLKNSTLIIKAGKDRVCIPVEADIQLDRKTLLGEMKMSILPMNQKITLWATANFLQGPVQMKIFAEHLYPEMLLAMVPDGEPILSKFHGPVEFSIETK